MYEFKKFLHTVHRASFRSSVLYLFLPKSVKIMIKKKKKTEKTREKINIYKKEIKLSSSKLANKYTKIRRRKGQPGTQIALMILQHSQLPSLANYYFSSLSQRFESFPLFICTHFGSFWSAGIYINTLSQFLFRH